MSVGCKGWCLHKKGLVVYKCSFLIVYGCCQGQFERHRAKLKLPQTEVHLSYRQPD